MMDELTKQSATKLAKLIRERAVSPVEVVEAHLRRIGELNQQLNAIVTLAPDALDRARELETALMRGGATGPLHGVPVTIKDTIETKGLRTTSGSMRRARHVPEEDAPAVARLKAAGAIIIGKTNASEMAIPYEADNPVFGRTNNPHDVARTPGGSSGGEAAAIAACLSSAGLGSDLTGSIRVPAHFCGVFGLKPTSARIPGAGHFPPATGPLSLGAAIGPMARYVADLSLLFKVLTDFGPFKNLSILHDNARGSETVNIRGWRGAWYAFDGVIPVTEETRRAVELAAKALAEAGLLIREEKPPGVECAPDLWSALFSRAAMNQLRDLYGGHEEEAGASVRAMLASADKTPSPTLDEFINIWTERDHLREILLRWMDETPLVLAPVGATHAFEHGARKLEISDQTVSVSRAFSYSQAFNVFDLPSVTVPVTRSREGLPIGVQIIGRPFEEDAVLAAALILEEAFGGWIRP